MNHTERLLRALRFERTDRTPVTGLMISVTVELMNLCGIPWTEAHHDEEKLVTLAAAFARYVLESLKLPFDMAVETEALGGEVLWGSIDTPPWRRPPR